MQRIWQPRAVNVALRTVLKAGTGIAGARLRAANPVLLPNYGAAVPARRGLHATFPTRLAEGSDFTIAPTERIAVEIDGGIATVTLQVNFHHLICLNPTSAPASRCEKAGHRCRLAVDPRYLPSTRFPFTYAGSKDPQLPVDGYDEGDRGGD